MTRNVSFGLLLFVQAVSMAAITTEELLDKFAETVDKTHTSFITQSKTHVHDNIKYGDPQAASMNGERDKFLIKEFRTDGKRMKIITQMWYGPEAKFANSESKKQYSSHTYDGDKRYDHVRPYDGAGSVTVFDKNAEKSLISLRVQFAYGDPVSQSFGYLIGDVERFDRILKEAGPGQMSVKEVKLNGTIHYVIDAETNKGRYKIWLNPEKGYNFSKAIVVRKEGDIFFGRSKVTPGTSKRSIVENTEFKKVDGLWVPVKTKSKMNDTLPNGGYMKSNFDIELTSIVIYPDHDALASFSINDIANGARASIAGASILYIWKDGKLVPNVDDAAEEKKIISPTVKDVLDKFTTTQNKLKSFIIRSHCDIKGLVRKPGVPDQEVIKKSTSEFCFDGNRSNIRFTTDRSNEQIQMYNSHLWDGAKKYQYTRGGDDPGQLFIARELDPKRKKQRFSRMTGIGACMGCFYGDDERIDTILRNSIKNGEKVSLQNKLEIVNGSKCHVIQAKTKRGKFKIWLDPEKDYNIVKAISQKRTGDFFYDKIAIEKDGYSTFKLNSVEYKKIGNTWVPHKSESQTKRYSPGNGYFESKSNREFTEILLDPDHDALGSFVLDDIVNGANVNIVGEVGKRYTWQNGELMPVKNKTTEDKSNCSE